MIRSDESESLCKFVTCGLSLNYKAILEQNAGFKVELGSSDAEARWFHGTSDGIVLQIGPQAWKQEDLGFGQEGWKPWVAVGDRVQYVDVGHRMVEDPVTKDKLFVVNDVDILLKIEG